MSAIMKIQRTRRTTRMEQLEQLQEQLQYENNKLKTEAEQLHARNKQLEVDKTMLNSVLAKNHFDLQVANKSRVLIERKCDEYVQKHYKCKEIIRKITRELNLRASWHLANSVAQSPSPAVQTTDLSVNSTLDDADIECVGTSTWEQRDEELRKQAICIED